jgi:hypothetical protein
MANLIRTAAIAAIATAAWAGAASFTPASAAPQEGLTQELSAACRTVTTSRWHNGRRVTTRKRVCTPGYVYSRPAVRVTTGISSCRYVTKTRWSNGRRITVRSRVC